MKYLFICVFFSAGCCFAKHDYRPGDVIFSELPTLAATPSLDPPLWEALTALNKEEPLDLPPIWHLAALYSLTKLPRTQKQVILEKWVPGMSTSTSCYDQTLIRFVPPTSEKNKAPSRDVSRILHKTRLGVDPRRYEYFLQVWRYNSFGHHVETEGLVLYDREPHMTVCQ